MLSLSLHNLKQDTMPNGFTLGPVRTVYKSASGKKCYKLGSEYYECNNKNWEKINEAVFFKPDYYEIRDRFYFVDKETGLVTPEKVEVIRKCDTYDKAKMLYQDLLNKSDLLEQNKDKIRDIKGLVGWLPSIINSPCFKKFDPDYIKKTYTALRRICGGYSETGLAIRYLTANILKDLRNYDKKIFENPELDGSPDSGERLNKDEIKKILRYAELIFEAAHSLSLIDKINPKFLYVPSFTKEKKPEPDFNEHAKTLLIGGIVRRVEDFRGTPWTVESYRERLFVLVAALKLWKPDRFPMYKNAVFSRFCIEEPILFNSPWAPEWKAETITLDLFLPHVNKNMQKGYSPTVIPTPLMDLFRGLYYFKKNFADKVGGNCDPLMFSRSANGLEMKDNIISDEFNEQTFSKWFIRLQKEEEIPVQSRINSHQLKDNFFSRNAMFERSEYKKDLTNKMLILNNKLEKVIKDHYLDTIKIRGVTVYSNALKAELSMAVDFEQDWNSYLTGEAFSNSVSKAPLDGDDTTPKFPKLPMAAAL